MLLVPYPFASILSIVFPSMRFLSNVHAFIFGLRAVYSFACFASQTQGLCSAFPRPSFEIVRFCLSRIVLRTSLHIHRVCAMLFPRSPLKFVRLCLLCYVMRTSPHKHRVFFFFFFFFFFFVFFVFFLLILVYFNTYITNLQYMLHSITYD